MTDFKLKLQDKAFAEEIYEIAEEGKIYPIMEIFKTYEGEGSYIGEPRILIRFGGCLVGCIGCDTAKSWTLAYSGQTTLQGVMDEIESLNPSRTQVFSFTGGEPMHYPKQVMALNAELKNRYPDCTTSLETSGVVFDDQVVYSVDRLSIDIKTPSSGVTPTYEMLVKIWKLSKTRGVQVKCVITDRHDLDWIEKNIDSFLYSDTPLILTPAAGTDHSIERMQKIMDMILDWNKDYNIRVIPQIHVLLKFR